MTSGAAPRTDEACSKPSDASRTSGVPYGGSLVPFILETAVQIWRTRQEDGASRKLEWTAEDALDITRGGWSQRPEGDMTIITEPCPVCDEPDQRIDTRDGGERRTLACERCGGPFTITNMAARKAKRDGFAAQLSAWLRAETDLGEDIGEIDFSRLKMIMRCGMRLNTVTIRNFRCIRELSVDLDDTTVLIGENNSGKTAFLEAIRICLEQLRGRGGGAFQDYDYHLHDESAAPADAEPIEIELSFLEPGPDAWADELIQDLADIAVLHGDGRHEVRFHLRSVFDRETGESRVEWNFLDAQGNPLTGTVGSSGRLMTLQRLVPVFYLSCVERCFQALRGARTFLAYVSFGARHPGGR